MSYIDETLLVEEKILYRTYTHWIVFVSSVFWTLVSIVLFTQQQMIALFGLVTLVMAVYDFSLSLIRYKTSEFGVTNKRVLVKVGWIRRHSVETFLQKVEGIQAEQDIFGRIFNYGTITIIGTGGSRDRFALINDPLEFRRQVQQQIEKVITDFNDRI